MSDPDNPTDEEREHVTEDQLGELRPLHSTAHAAPIRLQALQGAKALEGEGATARERDLREVWEHTERRDQEVADALVVIAEHAAGVTTTGPLCPAIAAVLVFVARNAGKREVET